MLPSYFFFSFSTWAVSSSCGSVRRRTRHAEELERPPPVPAQSGDQPDALAARFGPSRARRGTVRGSSLTAAGRHEDPSEKVLRPGERGLRLNALLADALARGSVRGSARRRGAATNAWHGFELAAKTIAQPASAAKASVAAAPSKQV